MSFEAELSGGHPNSLGNTVSVVERVLGNEELLDSLIETYSSSDEVVRLRVSNAIKRVTRERPGWVYGRLARIVSWVRELRQPSAEWTLAQLFALLSDHLSEREKEQGVEILCDQLARSTDWIVLSQSMATLGDWAREDPVLAERLAPRARELARDPRKSVAGRAKKILAIIAT